MNPSGSPPCTAVFVVLPDSATPGNYYGYNLSYGNYGTDILWDFGDGTTSTDPYPVHQYASPGNYILCLTVGVPGTNCYDTYCDSSFYSFKTDGNPMGQLTILSPTGIDKISSNKTILYPNPGSRELNITSASKIEQIVIYNANGQFVNSLEHPGNKIDIANLTSGIYYVNVKSGKQKKLLKFVKQ
jgi:PKD repeat protein